MKNKKLILLCIFAVVFVIPSVSVAEQNSVVPKFKDYPANIVYIGIPATVILSTNNENLYRTRLREASKQPINFAGEYVLTTWGCGTDCLQGAVVSPRTGRVVFLPGTICCWKGDGEKLLFRVNSRLLVAAGIINDKGEHGAHFYEFTGNEFKHISTIPMTEKSGDTDSSSSPLLTEQEKTNIVQQEKQIENQQQTEKTLNPTKYDVIPRDVDISTVGMYKGSRPTGYVPSQAEQDAQYARELELQRANNNDITILIFLSVVSIGILIVGVKLVKKLYQLYDKLLNILKATIYIQRGIESCERRDDYDQAMQFFEQGLAIAQKIGHQQLIAHAYSNIGNIYLKRDYLDEAILMYQQSLATYKELGRKKDMAMIYINLGLVHEMRGELDQAERMYEHSLVINQGFGQKESVAFYKLMKLQNKR